MTGAGSEFPPAGWYPDPGGASQWRHWTGTDWTGDLQPFAPAAPPLGDRLEAIRAHAQLARYGVVCFFGGLAMLANVDHNRAALLAHGLGTLADVLVGGALAVFFLGHLAFARAATALAGTFRLLFAVPVANVVAWAWWAGVRTSYPLPVGWRASVNRQQSTDALRWMEFVVVAVVLSDVISASQLGWGVVVPAVATAVNLSWVVRVRDDVAASGSGPPPTPR